MKEITTDTPTWEQIREVANEVDQMAVQSVQRACDLGDMLRAVRLTMDGESFAKSVWENLSRSDEWARRMITLSFRRHEAMTCDNPTAAYEEVKALPAPDEEVEERKRWPKAKRGPEKGNGGRPKVSDPARPYGYIQHAKQHGFFGVGNPTKKQCEKFKQDALGIDGRLTFDESTKDLLESACLTLKARTKPVETVSEARKNAVESRQQLATTAQQKLDNAIRAYKRQLDAEFEVRIQERVTAELNKILPSYNEEHARWQSFNHEYEGVFTRDEFRKLLSCLHSDRFEDEGTKKKYDAMFHLIRSKEEVLCGMREQDKARTSLPKTVAELMARRKAH